MIDVYVPAGVVSDPHHLAGTSRMRIENVPDIALFRQNTAAFVHELTTGSWSDVEGSQEHIRIQVLTNAGALNREQQLQTVAQMTETVTRATGDPSWAARTWVLLTEATPGGWGPAGHANTNEELITLARAKLGHTTPASPGAT